MATTKVISKGSHVEVQACQTCPSYLDLDLSFSGTSGTKTIAYTIERVTKSDLQVVRITEPATRRAKKKAK